MTPKERFLRALHAQSVDRPSVGNPTSIATVDLMEQTGCFFPDVHHDPEKMADLAAAGYERLGYDTVAPYFSVVQESAAFGAAVDWGAADRMPSVRPFDDGSYLYQEPEQIQIPKDFLDHPATRSVIEAIRLLKRRYGDEVAIIGKVFGPWTLAYHLFGLENFLILVLDDPDKLRRILDRLKEVPVLFARAQIEAGADCLTLADHLTGDLCRGETYRDFLLPVHQWLRRHIDCPVILHICGYTLDRLEFICQSGFDAFHFDSKNDARQAMQIAAGRIVLVGNVNNPESLYGGDEDRIRSEVRYALEAGVPIIGPECAVPLNTESRYLRLITDAVEEYAASV
ncbi:MAG: MtaA/CmuA family methyltransferase [Planctomycetes bacterium]|nr:MtaA/CmuA family methyltransferase [Planctomycetota bacterium]